jgi:hypothetical protein
MSEELYREQYCPIHDQHYSKTLKQCPICVGEEIAKDMNIIRDACKHNPDQIGDVVTKIIGKHGESWGEYFTKFTNSVFNSMERSS